MGTNCAPLVADLFLYCHERDFLDSLNHDYLAYVIEAFNSMVNSTSRYIFQLIRFLNLNSLLVTRQMTLFHQGVRIGEKLVS